MLQDGRAYLASRLRTRVRIVEHWCEEGTHGLYYCTVEDVRDAPLSDDERRRARDTLSSVRDIGQTHRENTGGEGKGKERGRGHITCSCFPPIYPKISRRLPFSPTHPPSSGTHQLKLTFWFARSLASTVARGAGVDHERRRPGDDQARIRGTAVARPGGPVLLAGRRAADSVARPLRLAADDLDDRPPGDPVKASARAAESMVLVVDARAMGHGGGPNTYTRIGARCRPPASQATALCPFLHRLTSTQAAPPPLACVAAPAPPLPDPRPSVSDAPTLIFHCSQVLLPPT